MKTVSGMVRRDVVGAVIFVALAFLSLFFFIDLVEALSRSARHAQSMAPAIVATLLRLPSHLYELLPIVVLIGSIYALARMAQASEFTVLRACGLTPWRALRLLLAPGIAFAALTMVLGEWIVPAAERQLASLDSVMSRAGLGGAGAWLKDSAGSAPGAASAAVHVTASGAGRTLSGIRIYEFDAAHRLLRRIEAPSAVVTADGHWRLADAAVTDWPYANTTAGQPTVALRRMASMDWRGSLSAEIVDAAVRPLESMTTLELWRYSRHLWSQEQSAQRYEIRFWKRLWYPLSCIVMVVLALPFAYLQARSGGISLKVFGGVMLGISFVLLNSLSGHLGLLRDWSAWAAAAAPAMLYATVSLLAFAWAVRLR
jgi:lipopolysaccharide export system permease protein